MRNDHPARGSGVLTLVLAAMAGLSLAEMIALILLEPGLLRPQNLDGLLALLVSTLLFYAVMAVVVLGFWAFLWIVSRLLRLGLSGPALAVMALVMAPFFLLVQDRLQESMLGMFSSVKTIQFYVPTAIALGLTVAGLVLAGLLGRFLPSATRRLRFLLDWRRLLPIAAALFLVVTLLPGKNRNVLGVFPEDQQRASFKETQAAPTTVAAPDSPSFIVLAVEAWRRDEFTAQTAPFLHELARQNVEFENYYTVASATRPSVTSFFTSLYPAQHGCYNLALSPGLRKGPQTTTKVAESIVSFPQILLEHGYQTLEITSNVLAADPAFGFQEVYQWFNALHPYDFQIPSLESLIGFTFLKDHLNRAKILKMLVQSPQHSTNYFDAERVNQTVRRRLGELTREPFFLYVHYMEPHSPYYHRPYRPLQLNLYLPSQREKLLGAYREEIGAIDGAIRDLFGFLQEKGLLENTYVLITADHGEEFYDHHDWGHGKTLYPEVIHVPAILVTPDQDGGRRVAAAVQNIDIGPTFVQLAGLPAPEVWEGESLVPTLKGEDQALGPVRAQFDNGRQFWTTMIEDGRQLLTRQRGEQRKTMLFDLRHDPLGQKDLFQTENGRAQEMLASLDAEMDRLSATAPLFQATEEAIDPQQLEQLRALGYVH